MDWRNEQYPQGDFRMQEQREREEMLARIQNSPPLNEIVLPPGSTRLTEKPRVKENADGSYDVAYQFEVCQ